MFSEHQQQQQQPQCSVDHHMMDVENDGSNGCSSSSSTVSESVVDQTQYKDVRIRFTIPECEHVFTISANVAKKMLIFRGAFFQNPPLPKTHDLFTKIVHFSNPNLTRDAVQLVIDWCTEHAGHTETFCALDQFTPIFRRCGCRNLKYDKDRCNFTRDGKDYKLDEDSGKKCLESTQAFIDKIATPKEIVVPKSMAAPYERCETDYQKWLKETVFYEHDLISSYPNGEFRFENMSIDAFKNDPFRTIVLNPDNENYKAYKEALPTPPIDGEVQWPLYLFHPEDIPKLKQGSLSSTVMKQQCDGKQKTRNNKEEMETQMQCDNKDDDFVTIKSGKHFVHFQKAVNFFEVINLRQLVAKKFFDLYKEMFLDSPAKCHLYFGSPCDSTEAELEQEKKVVEALEFRPVFIDPDWIPLKIYFYEDKTGKLVEDERFINATTNINLCRMFCCRDTVVDNKQCTVMDNIRGSMEKARDQCAKDMREFKIPDVEITNESDETKQRRVALIDGFLEQLQVKIDYLINPRHHVIPIRCKDGAILYAVASALKRVPFFSGILNIFEDVINSNNNHNNNDNNRQGNQDPFVIDVPFSRKAMEIFLVFVHLHATCVTIPTDITFTADDINTAYDNTNEKMVQYASAVLSCNCAHTEEQYKKIESGIWVRTDYFYFANQTYHEQEYIDKVTARAFRRDHSLFAELYLMQEFMQWMAFRNFIIRTWVRRRDAFVSKRDKRSILCQRPKYYPYQDELY